MYIVLSPENIFLAPFSVKVKGEPWRVCYWRFRNTFCRLMLYSFGSVFTFATLVCVVSGKYFKQLVLSRYLHLCIADVLLVMAIIDWENAYTGWSACHYRFLSHVGGYVKACSPWPFALMIILGFALIICEVLYALNSLNRRAPPLGLS